MCWGLQLGPRSGRGLRSLRPTTVPLVARQQHLSIGPSPGVARMVGFCQDSAQVSSTRGHPGLSFDKHGADHAGMVSSQFWCPNESSIPWKMAAWWCSAMALPLKGYSGC